MTCETCNDLRDKLDEAEQALRLVSLYSDESDPADSDGLSPQEIVDAAKAKFDGLRQQLTAAQERVKELESGRQSAQCSNEIHKHSYEMSAREARQLRAENDKLRAEKQELEGRIANALL